MEITLQDQYEISLWKDIWDSTSNYWKEEKLYIIGGNNRHDNNAIFNPVLKLDMYGQETFSFDIYSQHFDEGQQVKNPYINDLVNEAKIKVWFNNKWYDFIIKEVNNQLSKEQIIHYNCQSLAMYELGKSGYDITLSEDTNNNVLGAEEFMEIALAGTDWQTRLAPKDELFLLESCQEWAYQLSYSGTILGYEVTYELDELNRYTRKISSTATSLTNGLIYIPYSERENGTQIITFVNTMDENDVEYDRYSFVITNGKEYSITSQGRGTLSKFKINNHTRTKETEYNNTYEGYVDIYRNGSNPIYYGFVEYTANPYLKIYNKQYLSTDADTTSSIGIIVMDNSKYYKYAYAYKLTTSSTWIFPNGGSAANPVTITKAAYNFLKLSPGTKYDFKVICYYKDDSLVEHSDTLTISATTYSNITDSALMTDEEIQAYEAKLKSNYITYYSKNKDLSNKTSTKPTGYELSYRYDKIRTLSTQESNRFNITQDICEAFEIWCRYEIEHENDGYISTYTDSKGKHYKKYVTLKDEYGQVNKLGFKYNQNLKKITRNIKSDSIITKLFINDIEDDTLDSGYCSITNSVYNISKENFLINFDYFISKGYLDETTTRNNISTYYLALREQNKLLDAQHDLLYDSINGLTIQKATLEGNQIYYESERDAALEVMASLEQKGKEDEEEYATQSTRYKTAVAALKNINAQMPVINTKIKTANATIDTINDNITALNNNFYKKYSRFIQEGTWVGESYRDDNTYYSDAQKVSSDNAYPKIEYSLDIIDIHNLIDLETEWDYTPYAINVGDISTIEDKQYFENQEEVVVSEVTYYLNEPSKNSITIQNYTTQFEDLFSKLNATVSSYDLNKNTYSKAENFTGTGALTFKSLQSSFDQNKELAYSNVLSTLEYDSAGIRISSIDKQNIVKLTSGGIVLSSDGGNNWYTGIYDGKINTKILSAGQINAEEINIMLGENHRYPNFVWNGYGLNAYKWQQTSTATVYNYNKKVVFNDIGIYGFSDATGTYDVNDDDGVTSAGIMSNDKVWFALTWDGLKIKLPNTGKDNTIINVNDKFKVFGDGSISATDGTFSGSLSGATGTFKGSLSAATGTFSGDISGSTGTFTGVVNASDYQIDGESILSGSSINGEYIDSISAGKITAGTLDAKNIELTNEFTIKNGTTSVGYIGAALGQADTTITKGVAMATAAGNLTHDTQANYLIVTDNGVRLTYNIGGNENSIYVSSNGVRKVVNGVDSAIGDGIARFG